MKKIIKSGFCIFSVITVIGFCYFIDLKIFVFSNPPAFKPTPNPSRLIAHAGGEIQGLRYTNSLEAIQSSYQKGIRFIELDIDWTMDGQLVLIHGWQDNMQSLFNKKARRYSLTSFKHFDMVNDLTQLTFADLATWLKANPDVYIVTDVKRANLVALALISKMYPDIIDQLIPQVYSFLQHRFVQSMHYSHIILTLYRSDYSDNEILQFAEGVQLDAITMPNSRGLTSLPRKLNELGVRTYTHTVNDEPLRNKLYANGVFGVYTDILNPE